MNTKEIFNHHFRFNKLNALRQFHLAKRILPLLTEVVGVPELFSKLKIEMDGKEEIDFDKIAKAVGPVVNAIAKMPDEDSELIIKELLSVVQIKGLGDVFTPVVGAPPERVFLNSVVGDNLHLMLRVAYESFMVNLNGFLQALPENLKEKHLQQAKV